MRPRPRWSSGDSHADDGQQQEQPFWCNDYATAPGAREIQNHLSSAACAVAQGALRGVERSRVELCTGRARHCAVQLTQSHVNFAWVKSFSYAQDSTCKQETTRAKYYGKCEMDFPTKRRDLLTGMI